MPANKKLSVNVIQEDAEPSLAVVVDPTMKHQTTDDSPPASHNNNNNNTTTHRRHHQLWTSKRLSVAWTAADDETSSNSSGSLFRLSFLTSTDPHSQRLADEITAAQQAMGVTLYPYIQEKYYNNEANQAHFLQASSDGSDKTDDLVIAQVLRPVWLPAFKDVSAYQGKRDGLVNQLRAVEEQLQQQQQQQQQEQSTATAKIQQWKRTWRQTVLQGQVQDLDRRMAQRKDAFGVALYQALQQQQQQQQSSLLLQQDSDKVLGEAYQQCQATIRGLVLQHQQKQQETMIKVWKNHYSPQQNDEVSLTTTPVVDESCCCGATVVVTPTKEKLDGEESVTEGTDDEYEDVEVET